MGSLQQLAVKSTLAIKGKFQSCSVNADMNLENKFSSLAI